MSGVAKRTVEIRDAHISFHAEWNEGGVITGYMGLVHEIDIDALPQWWRSRLMVLIQRAAEKLPSPSEAVT